MKKIYLNEFYKTVSEKVKKSVQKMMEKPRTFEEVKEQTRRLGKGENQEIKNQSLGGVEEGWYYIR